MDDVLTAIAMCVCFDPDSDSDDTCKKCKKPVKQKQAEVYRANIIAFKYATNDKKEGIVVAVNPVSSSVKLGIKVIKRRFVIAGALVHCEPFLKRLKRHIQEIQQNRSPVVDDLFTFIADAKADGNQKKPKYPNEKKFFEDPSLIAGFDDLTLIIMPYDDGERHVLDVCAIGGDKDAVEAKLTDVCRDKMTKKEAMKRGRQMIYWVTERMPTSESHYCVHIGPKKVGKVKIVTRAALGQEFQSGIEPQSRQKQPLRRISGQKPNNSPSKSSNASSSPSGSGQNASGSGQQASGGASGSGEQPSNSAGNNQQPPDDNEPDSSSESDQDAASSSDTDDQDSSEPEPEETPPEPEPDQEAPPVNGAFGGANGENDPWNAEENVNPDDQPPPPPDNLPPPQPGIQPPPPPDNGLEVIPEEAEDADDEMEDEDEQVVENGVGEGVAPLAVAEEDLEDESEAEAEAQLQVEPEQNGDLDEEGSDNVFDD